MEHNHELHPFRHDDTAVYRRAKRNAPELGSKSDPEQEIQTINHHHHGTTKKRNHNAGRRLRPQRANHHRRRKSEESTQRTATIPHGLQYRNIYKSRPGHPKAGGTIPEATGDGPNELLIQRA